MEQPFSAAGIAHFVLNVRDLEKSVAFYRMFDPKAGEDLDRVRVALGGGTRLLIRHGPDLAPQGQGNLDHFAVVLEGAADVESVLAFMRAHGAEPYDGPRTNTSGRTQFRVKDPDGNEVEVQLK
ncbi:MAG: VOC family protein [Chloroflexi bacterium]|nr:VOC family protein [Chloroflexota bacterium]